MVGIVLIESFTGIVRAFAFFIHAAIGIQELAVVIMGSFLGLSNARKVYEYFKEGIFFGPPIRSGMDAYF